MSTYREAVSTWMKRAQCRGVRSFTELPILTQLAACQGCPVRSECLAFGLDLTRTSARTGNGVHVGCVYGGETPRSLTDLARGVRP